LGKDVIMQAIKFSSFFLVSVCLILVAGCDSQLKDLRIQNDILNKRKAELESELQAATLQLEQLKRQLDDARKKSGIEEDTLRQQIAALEEDLAKKQELIASLQKQLLGVPQLPVELSTMLEDFARQNQEMVTFDASRGIVKFKSDLLFEKGSDEVKADAAEAVKTLCGILNSEQGKQFDIIIAGHTDDIPIARAETRQKHPTNWHLSAHRAISVLDVMVKSNIDSERLSVRGFGEFRPIAPNEPNHRGNPLNRRVEIYIVPKGT